MVEAHVKSIVAAKQDHMDFNLIHDKGYSTPGGLRGRWAHGRLGVSGDSGTANQAALHRAVA